MKSEQLKKVNYIKLFALIIQLSTITFTHTFAQQKPAERQTAAIGTSQIWGKVDGLSIEGLVQGPSSAQSDLQIACIFEYTEGDIFISPPALPASLNGLVHLDEALKGKLTTIRSSGKFTAKPLETLLLGKTDQSIASKKLLLIGLGRREDFNAELMLQVGRIAMREALRLQAVSLSFASDLKDAGVDSPTALIAENVVMGAVDAYRTQRWLEGENLDTPSTLQKLILLAGPSFFSVAGEGISKAIVNLQHQ